MSQKEIVSIWQRIEKIEERIRKLEKDSHPIPESERYKFDV